ncbi:acyltransferase domain-containing protein, partial [Streptomyces sp. NPDC001920]
TGRPRRAAVSSFGISGTNAHLILEQAPDQPEAAAPDPVAGEPRPLPWPVSARSEKALRAQAARLHSFVLDHSDVDVHDIGHTLTTTRATGFQHRAAIVGADREDFLAGLEALARGDGHSALVVSAAAAPPGRTVFVFPGQGSQWLGMADELLETAPVFAEKIRACADALDPLTGWSLVDALRGTDGAPELDRVDVVQPALFAVMVSLAALWRSFGVEPDAVMGHSQGEIAAAHVADALSLEDAARVVALRSKAITALAGTGGMASVPLPVNTVRERLAAWGDRLGVAAVNGPRSTVIAGEHTAVDEAVAAYRADGVRARRIPVDYASHTPHVEAIQDQVLDALGSLAPRAARIPFYSTVTAGPVDTTELDAGYWYRNLRRTVRFEETTRALLDDGHGLFIEASPHPVLTVGLQETVDAYGADAAVLESLRRSEGGVGRFTASLARAYTHGVDVNWLGAFAHRTARTVPLPTYAFQHTTYWLDAPAPSDVRASGMNRADHPLLGAVTELPDGGHLFTGSVSMDRFPWLGDHRVFGSVLLPGAAFTEAALHVARHIGAAGVEELTLHAPLVLAEREAADLQVITNRVDDAGEGPGDGAGDGARYGITIRSRSTVPATDGGADAGAGTEWTVHATGFLTAAEPPEPAGRPGVWPPAGAQPVGLDDFYERLGDMGVGYGDAFRGVRAAWRKGDELFAELAGVPEPDGSSGGSGGDARSKGFGVHPALLDAALQLVFLRPSESDAAMGVVLPFSWSSVSLHSVGARAERFLARVSPGPNDGVRVELADERGRPVASIGSLTVRPVTAAQLERAAGGPQRLFHVTWQALRTPSDESVAPLGPWALLEPADDNGAGDGDGGGRGLIGRYGDLSALGAAVDAGKRVPALVVARFGADGTPAYEDGEPREPVGRVHEATREALALLQRWLADDRFTDARLVVATRNAVSGGPATPAGDGGAVDLVGASVWGLVRSAQAENPGRFVLLDMDAEPDAALSRAGTGLAAALGSGEPQLALRDGTVLVPRLARVPAPVTAARTAPDHDVPRSLDPEGTVLITGGTGTLGSLIARHLVTH